MNALQTPARPAVADLIRWGPIIAGVLIATAVFTTANAAWFALAYASPDNDWRSALPWLLGVTAALSLLLAGLFAGVFSGIRGVIAGMANGATAWGLFFLVSIAAVIPGAFNLNAQLRESFAAIDDGASDASRGLWTAFWALLAGAALAVIGGAVGGALRRPVRMTVVRGMPPTEFERTEFGTGSQPESERDARTPLPAERRDDAADSGEYAGGVRGRTP